MFICSLRGGGGGVGVGHALTKDIKPESEISLCLSVVSYLFHTRYLHFSSLLVTFGVKLVTKLSRGSLHPHPTF